jgi:hypothetical protein
MPQVPSNGPPPKRSEDQPKTPHSGGSSGIFTAEFPDRAARNADSPPSGHGGGAPPDLSSEITEPFPEGFVRLPVPDSLFRDMRGLSDSAFRALLGLVRLSFRFDPEASQWVCPDRTFSRADIQAECGLSGQGTRNGLQELESEGYVSVDRSGRSYEHALEVGVPSCRFTYVPTDLFEEAPRLTGTELRLVLAVLRATWGWTEKPEGGGPPVHQRWAQLSTRTLSRLTGRSESAVKTAAQGLQGRWIQRRRPWGGAYRYRFRSEVLTSEALATETGPEEEPSAPGEVAVQRRRKAFFSMGLPMDYPPDRQQSGPPRRGKKEKFPKRLAKHSGGPKRDGNPQESSPSRNGDSAVRGPKAPSPGSVGRSALQSQPEETRPERGSHQSPRGASGSAQDLNLTGFSGRKRALGQKLANAGVWPRRIPELLGRYSADRIEANLQLYRQRAQQVKKSGAWLAAAIEGGYALPSPSEGSPSEGSPSEAPGGDPGAAPSGAGSPTPTEGESAPALPEPGTKVPKERKEALIQTGQAEQTDFDRAPSDERGTPRFFYKIEPGPSPAAPNLRR